MLQFHTSFINVITINDRRLQKMLLSGLISTSMKTVLCSNNVNISGFWLCFVDWYHLIGAFVFETNVSSILTRFSCISFIGRKGTTSSFHSQVTNGRRPHVRGILQIVLLKLRESCQDKWKKVVWQSVHVRFGFLFVTFYRVGSNNQKWRR